MRAVTVDDQAIGRLIRDARIKKGMAIKDIAPAIVVTPQQMQKYELGQNRITAANIVKISEILDVDVGELLGTREAISPQARTLAVAFDSLPESPLKTLVLNLMLAAVQSSKGMSDRTSTASLAEHRPDIGRPGSET